MNSEKNMADGEFFLPFLSFLSSFFSITISKVAKLAAGEMKPVKFYRAVDDLEVRGHGPMASLEI